MTGTKKRFDVVVIGAGITGLSAALHLQGRGVRRVGLSSSTKAHGATRLAAGLGTGGFIDNFTRFSHHFGAPAAAELWRFAGDALASLVEGARGLGVEVATGQHYRLITGDDEHVEATRAVAELKGEGFSAHLRDGATRIGGLPLAPQILAVQDDDGDGVHALSLDRAALMKAMAHKATATPVAEVQSIRAEGSGLALRHADDSETHCEMVVCAAHLGIGKLVPEIASALVAVADQWCRVRLPAGKTLPKALIGSVFSAKHGHEWGGFTAPNELILGGARYLRKWAGIEATEATTEARISEHLLKLAVQRFGLDPGSQVVEAHGFLDCRPCDELPIIGPLFGEGRVLMATGFLGAGLTLGWLAGDCLAELVATGKSARLPRRLWPERLRTLGS